MKKALVTGGAGFIGSHIVQTLINMGWEVTVLDNFLTGKRENLSELIGKFRLIEGDLRNLADCETAVAGVDFVYHQGAIPAVPRSVVDPISTNDANISGTLNLLWSAKKAGVKRVVFAGSSAVYGNLPESPKVETMPVCPLSPYAVQKLASEFYHKVFSKIFGLETVVLRYFNVFGPRQDPNSDYAAVIPKFIVRMLKGEQPIIYGDGLQTRDFVYVADVVQANILASTASSISGCVFNIASGEENNLLTLVNNLNEILGTNIQPKFAPSVPGDVRNSHADITQAKKWLGFVPQISFKEGLKRTVEWYKMNQNTA